MKKLDCKLLLSKKFTHKGRLTALFGRAIKIYSTLLLNRVL